jgi:hypothetical protein
MYAVLLIVILASAGSLLALSVLNANTGPSVILVGRDGTQREIFLSDITQRIDLIEATSGYQNRFNTTGAQGIYKGIKISDLIQYVGGMELQDLLVVEAGDGYTQYFTHSNVYPNSTIFSYQGDFILAYSFNGTLVPDYQDGYRTMFIPSDGLYENLDAEKSTQVEYYVGSAGARCVSNVATITIIPNGS